MQMYSGSTMSGASTCACAAAFASRTCRAGRCIIAEAVAFRALGDRCGFSSRRRGQDLCRRRHRVPSQTAALLEPYLDEHGHPTSNRGPSYFTQDNLNRIVSAADAAGLTVHVHAIGDRAVRAALDAFAYSRRHNGAVDSRDQIAHLELIDPADFPRFKELGVIANFQLLWAERDDYIVKSTLPYIGPERARYLYPARSLRDAGALIAGGSDWKVSSFDAFEAMEHAITRAQARGQRPFFPSKASASRTRSMRTRSTPRSHSSRSTRPVVSSPASARI